MKLEAFSFDLRIICKKKINQTIERKTPDKLNINYWPGGIAYYHKLDLSDKHIAAIEKLAKIGFTNGANFEKLNNNTFSFRVDQCARILCQITKLYGLNTLVILAILDDHEYDKSKWVRMRHALSIDNPDTSTQDSLSPMPEVNKETTLPFQRWKKAYHLLSEDHYVLRDASQETFCKLESKQIMLLGPPGAGKTDLVLSLVKERLMEENPIGPMKFLYITPNPLLALDVKAKFEEALRQSFQIPSKMTVSFVSVDDFYTSYIPKDSTLTNDQETLEWLASYKKARKASIKKNATLKEVFKNPEYILAEFKSIAVLSKQEYPGVGVRQSLFSEKNEQLECLKLYNNYQNHLQTNKLVHPHFYEFNTVVPEYNGVIFDELPLASVQCVLQVLRFLAAEPLPFIYLLGDPLQNNANHHSIIDLMQRKIQEKYNIKIGEHQLDTTYRNPPSVTKLANHIMEIRQFSNRGIHDTHESRTLRSSRDQEADTLPVDWRYGVHPTSLKEKLNRPNASLLDLMKALDSNQISSAPIKKQLQELKAMLLSLKEELSQPFVMLLTSKTLKQELTDYFNFLDQKENKSSRLIIDIEKVQGLQARKVILFYPLDDATIRAINTEIQIASPEKLEKSYHHRPGESGHVSPHVLKLSSLLAAVTRAMVELAYITTAPHQDNKLLLNALQNGLHANPDTKQQVILQAPTPSPQSIKLTTWADWKEWILNVYRQLGAKEAQQIFDTMPQNIKTLASAKTFSQFEIQHQLKSAPSSTPLTATAAAAATVGDKPKPSTAHTPAKPAPTKRSKKTRKKHTVEPNLPPKAAAPNLTVLPTQNLSGRDIYLNELICLLKSEDKTTQEKTGSLLNLLRYKTSSQLLFEPFVHRNADEQPETLIGVLLCNEKLIDLLISIIKERPTLTRILNTSPIPGHTLHYLSAIIRSPDTKDLRTQIMTLFDLLLQFEPEIATHFQASHLNSLFEYLCQGPQGLSILSTLLENNPAAFQGIFENQPISGDRILSLLATPQGCQLLIDLQDLIDPVNIKASNSSSETNFFPLCSTEAGLNLFTTLLKKKPSLVNLITKKDLTGTVKLVDGTETTLLRQLAALKENNQIIELLMNNQELKKAIEEALPKEYPHPNRPSQKICVGDLIGPKNTSREVIPRVLLPLDFRNVHSIRYLSTEDEERIKELLNCTIESEFKTLLTYYLLSDCAESLLFDYLQDSSSLAFHLLRKGPSFKIFREIIEEYPRIIDLFTIQRLSHPDCHHSYLQDRDEYCSILETIVLLNKESSDQLIKLLFQQKDDFVMQLNEMLLIPSHKASYLYHWSLLSLLLKNEQLTFDTPGFKTLVQDPRFSLALFKSCKNCATLFHELCSKNTRYTLELLTQLNVEFISDGLAPLDLMVVPDGYTEEDFTYLNLLVMDKDGYDILCYIKAHNRTAFVLTPEAFLGKDSQKINSVFYVLSKKKNASLLSFLMENNPHILSKITSENLLERKNRKVGEMPLIYNLMISGTPYHLELLEKILLQLDFKEFFNHEHHCPLIIELIYLDQGLQLIKKLLTRRPDMFNKMPDKVFFDIFENKCFYVQLVKRPDAFDLIEYILEKSEVVNKQWASGIRELQWRATNKQLTYEWIKKDKHNTEILASTLAESINHTMFAPPPSASSSVQKYQAAPKKP